MNEKRTFKSLQVSYQHWMKSSRLSQEIKDKIKNIYYQEDRGKKGAEQIYQEIIHIEIEACKICGHKQYIGFSCPNILPSGNVLPDNPTDGQIIHYNSWKKNFQKGVDNRDNTYIIERNKTLKMRESSRKVGLKTGGPNIKKAHEKYDKIIPCYECSEKDCNKRNCYPLNTILIGIGCLTKHNSSELMRKATSDRNLKNWATDPDYRKRIAQNLGVYLGKKKQKQVINKQNKVLSNFFSEKIKNFNEETNSESRSKNKKKICCIYGWYINHRMNNDKVVRKLIYVGQTVDLKRRNREHLINIFNFPKWWGIADDENDILEVQIIKECNKDQLNYYETKFINELHPWSQDIDYGASGNNIIPLNMREKLDWIS